MKKADQPPADIALRRAEKRLGARFPDCYKEVFRSLPWATGLRRWELHEPEGCEWLSDSCWSRAEDSAARKSERRVLLIATDIGGDALALKRKKGDDSQLAATVYRFDHDSGQLTRLASSLLDLFKPPKRRLSLEQQASAILKAAEDADKERKRQERDSDDRRIVERVTALGGDKKAAARELGVSLSRVRAACRRLEES